MKRRTKAWPPKGAEATVTCALCGQVWPWELTNLPEQTAKAEHGVSLPQYLVWACANCVHAGKAEDADPSRQNYGGLGSPCFLSYWDQERQCEYCGESYTCTAAQQRRMFEDKGLHVQTRPTACEECGRQLARRKHAQAELRRRKPAADLNDWAALAELAELAWQAGSLQQGLDYLRRAKNRSPEDEKQRLQESIAEMERVGPSPGPVRKFRSGVMEQSPYRVRRDSTGRGSRAATRRS